jgi:L-ascorbate metabolism protein UlaG (beta-lactamase superfamily)
LVAKRAGLECADHADARASLFCPRPVRSQPRTLGRIHADGGSRAYLFAGDTAYAPFFHDIRQRLGPIDLALLPIGTYEPRWFMQSVHMNPAEAVQAHLDLGASESIAMHFGTFQMTAEGIDEPMHALEEARRAKHVPASAFRILGFGESL